MALLHILIWFPDEGNVFPLDPELVEIEVMFISINEDNTESNRPDDDCGEAAGKCRDLPGNHDTKQERGSDDGKNRTVDNGQDLPLPYRPQGITVIHEFYETSTVGVGFLW